ncbi:MAG: UbiA prenyltransferase family protein [Cytophagales bacterium]|nr:UbiA prenyltransferase family protein [Cytophagales bacterium]
MKKIDSSVIMNTGTLILSSFASVLKLMRVKHYTKNLFLFIPLFFSGELLSSAYLVDLLFAFLAFCLVASALYTFNDLMDVEKDRMHPAKKNRPIAAGLINIKTGYLIFAMLLLLGMGLGVVVSARFFIYLGIYFAINMLYSTYLKHFSIIDIVLVSTGFVLRVLAGGEVAQVAISHWLIIMVFFLAMLLALAKRRDDALILEKQAVASRKNIRQYPTYFIDAGIGMLCGVIIVAYLMYCLSPEVMERLDNQRIFYTTFFVITGVLRYLQITLVENKSGSPTYVLLHDRFTAINLLIWGIYFFLILYIF